MGVSHLKQYSDSAAQASTGYKGAVNLAGGPVPKAGKSMPAHSGVNGYSREALRAAGTAEKHPRGGVRAGGKGAQPHLGASQKSILGKAHVLPSGGRKG